MEKRVYAILKLTNFIFGITLFVVWVFYSKQRNVLYNDLKGMIDPTKESLYDILSIAFLIAIIPIILGAFFKFKTNQFAFLGLTMMNLLLIFSIVLLFVWV